MARRLSLVALLVLTVSTPCAAQESPSNQWFTVASQLAHEEAFAGAHDVELSGNLAFVPGKKGAIAIVDVADREQPKLLWFRQDLDELSDSETVLPVGKHLLLGTRDFLSLDVSGPHNPVILKTISDRSRIDRINGMVMRGAMSLLQTKRAGSMCLM